ncbi:hypothetical protein ACFOYW_14475 [Gryllotalpicola reticulitermitis]|uniref:YtxH domain-containing protein n=1 Tax=Gryllotalpicola reticulitermitis TaxID=1184153 RepID=A0ABV8Q8A8_9MICO
MKTFFAFVVGIAVGFVAAHQFNRSEQGQRLFSGFEAKARDFGAAVADGYHSREAELHTSSN